MILRLRNCISFVVSFITRLRSYEVFISLQVDFSTLQMSTLKKYRKKFNLGGAQNLNKGELVAAVEKHFTTIPVNEGKDIINFLKYVRRTRVQRQQSVTPDVQS